MFKFKEFPSERLYKISKNIIEKAFFMGGYRINYYSANVCNYKFPNGNPCIDERTLTPSINCPICGGSGVTYNEPKEIRAIIIDNPDEPRKQREGVILYDTFRMVVPSEVPVKMLTYKNGDRIFLVRDKFEIFSSNNTVFTIVFVDNEPKDIWLAGMLYKTFKVSTHYLATRVAEGNKDINLNDKQYTEVTSTINKEYKINSSSNEDIEKILENILIEVNGG
jgi:hypothetical protein